MSALESQPFTKLRLGPSEAPVWSASDRTFHRSGDYALLLTPEALYLYSPFWLFLARWQRIPLKEIVAIEFRDSRWSPSLRIRKKRGSTTFRTPFGETDEMNYDRSNLANAVAQVVPRLRAHRSSEASAA